MAIVSIALLFAQNIAELALPSYMSDMVNTGIIRGGISETAPKVLSEDAFQFIKNHLPDEAKTIVANSYTQIKAGDSESLTKSRRKDFPELGVTKTGYVLKSLSNAETEQLGLIYGEVTYWMSIPLVSAQQITDWFNREYYNPWLERNPEYTEWLAGYNAWLAEDPAHDPLKYTPAWDGEEVPAIDISKIPASLLFSVDLKSVPSYEMASAELNKNIGYIINGTENLTEDEKEALDAAKTMKFSVGTSFTRAFYYELGADANSVQQSSILSIGFAMLAITVGVALITVANGFLSARISSGIGRNVRRDIFSKVQTFSPAEFDKFSTATLITRSTSDVSGVQQVAMMALRMILSAPIMGIGGIIYAVRINSKMSIIVVFAVAILLVMQIMLFKKVTPKFRIMRKLEDKMNLVARQMLNGVMVIRAFGNEKREEERFREANDNIRRTNRYVQVVMAVMQPMMAFLLGLTTLTIYFFGSKVIDAGNMEVGDLMAFMQYVMQIIMAFQQIAMMFIMIPQALVSANRLQEVLSVDTKITDKPADEIVTLGGRAKGEIEFKNVSFKYQDAESCVLENINFKAKAGETTAFIGSTGSGKSTLINLIPRFYDVTEGSITLDGVDIRDLAVLELRDNLGYVPQKGLLFSGTIASNMEYGKEGGTEEEFRQALDVAQASEFVFAQKEGLETAIDEGGDNLSGGQKQRMSIARALAKKPPVYIFDDSFSALDFKTDAALRRALKQYTSDATTLIVAQRISTIMQAEQIVVLDAGKVVGIGTHRELLDTCEAYREIAESQLSKEELA